MSTTVEIGTKFKCGTMKIHSRGNIVFFFA